MNHLFDMEHTGQIPEAEIPALRGLLGMICESQAKEFVAAFLRVTAEQLEDWAVDGPISASDAVALLNVTEYLAALNLDDAALTWNLPVQLLYDELDEIIKVFCDAAEQYGVKELRERILSDVVSQVFQPVDESELFRSIISVSGYDSVDEVLSNYHIFTDASALCSDVMKFFLDRLLPRITSLDHPLKITVPYSIVSCIEEMAADPEQALLSGAKEGIIQLKRIQDYGLLSVRGDEGDSTIMSTFLSALSRYKPRYQMMLLTQDEALANAVNLLNASGVEGPVILIVYLDEYGCPRLWFENEQEDESGTADQMTEVKELIEEMTETEEDLLKEIVPRSVEDAIEGQGTEIQNDYALAEKKAMDTIRISNEIPIAEDDEDTGREGTTEADLDEMASLTQRIDTLLEIAANGIEGDEEQNDDEKYVMPTGSEDLEMLEEEHLDAAEADDDSSGEAEKKKASETDGGASEDGKWDVIE